MKCGDDVVRLGTRAIVNVDEPPFHNAIRRNDKSRRDRQHRVVAIVDLGQIKTTNSHVFQNNFRDLPGDSVLFGDPSVLVRKD